MMKLIKCSIKRATLLYSKRNRDAVKLNKKSKEKLKDVFSLELDISIFCVLVMAAASFSKMKRISFVTRAIEAHIHTARTRYLGLTRPPGFIPLSPTTGIRYCKKNYTGRTKNIFSFCGGNIRFGVT